MGLFSKAKQGVTDAAESAGHAVDFHNQQQAAKEPGMIGVRNMGPIGADPALIGGPSTKPLAGGDPMLQPVQGLSLETYGAVAREAQARGVTDEDGMAAIAEDQHGIPAADAKAAFAVWIERMGQSMIVGQEFRRHLGY